MDQHLKNGSETTGSLQKPVVMIEKEPDFKKTAVAFQSSSSSSNNVQRETPNEQKLMPKNDVRNLDQLTFQKFDALKTPSYFLSKNSTLEKSQKSSDEDDDNDDADDVQTTEDLRQKRLAFFEKNVVENAKVTPTVKVVTEADLTRREIPEARIVQSATLTKDFKMSEQHHPHMEQVKKALTNVSDSKLMKQLEKSALGSNKETLTMVNKKPSKDEISNVDLTTAKKTSNGEPYYKSPRD